MADLQGVKLTITDMAKVCTEKQFADMCAQNENMLNTEYVRLNVNQVRGELCGFVTTGALQPNSVAVVPIDCSAYYLAFLLCSLPGQLFLFGQKLNVLAKININRKIVSALNVFKVEAASEEAYSIAELLKEGAFKQYQMNRDDLNYERCYRLVADLCDILAIELYAHPLFEEKGIFILENWKKVLDTNEDNSILSALLSLSKGDSLLRNEIMKAHILVNNISDYIK